MSLWILDTDTLSLFLRGEFHVCRRVSSVVPEELAVAIITVEEVLTGWYAEVRRARRDDQLVRAYASLQQAVEFFRLVRILPFDVDSVRRFHQLRRQHRRLGTNDLRIAAIAMEQLGIVVTRNERDFGLIEGVATEDWSN
ncbi:MAG: type II toxin-antitoxin system VapC family toxin [Planctomycetales bacterium]|nr:type II toxin-antitoxin system VapC family toxin [Planctomycetales bacterium]